MYCLVSKHEILTWLLTSKQNYKSLWTVITVLNEKKTMENVLEF